MVSGDPVKIEYVSAKASALTESDEDAVELHFTALLRMAAKNSAAFFCEIVRRTIPQKSGRTETNRRASGECQVSPSKEARGTLLLLA